MSRTLIINFELLEEVELSVSEFLFLTNLYFKGKLDVDTEKVNAPNMEERKFIKIIQKNELERELILRTKSIELVELCLMDVKISLNNNKKIVKKSRRQVNHIVEERIHEFRNKWKGLKAGSMGSLKACKIKLTRWIHENPDYNFDQILDAVDLYLSTEGLNTRYLQRADYFIFKQENNKEESSRLSAFIDDIDINKVQDWTSKLN